MKTVIINSFQEYLDYTECYKNKYYFRGQSNSGWDVIPSLFRNTCSLAEEQQLIKEEVSASNLNVISALFRLQHYGTPTRICDLTISPFSALFFAASDDSQKDHDGIVYVFDKTNQIMITSKEISVISRVLEGNISDLNAYEVSELEEILTKNYIIQYNYEFSYTNPRAILQGGTGLFFGFSYKDGQITQQTTLNVSEYISERIIIPADSKTDILNSLSRLGYSQEILYNTFENINNNVVEVVETSKEIYNRASFKKYVGKYKLSDLYYNRDDLISNISNIYDRLFLHLGNNARIWLFFYFDDNDILHGNWICRTEWTPSQPYFINWTKDYYQTRLRLINEQASRKEVFERFLNSLNQITPLYLDIVESIGNDSECLPSIIERIRKHELTIYKISSESNNIPFSDSTSEGMASLALSFINNVSWLVGDMLIFDDRGDVSAKEKETFYLLKSLYIDKCEHSKERLESFYQFRL